MLSENTLTDAGMPPLFEQSDPSAIHAQAWFFSLLGFELILVTLGTLVGLLSGIVVPAPAISVSPITLAGNTFTSVPIIELTAGGLIFIALVFRLIRFFGHFDSKWYEARAVAESVKSVAWRYAVGGRPFERSKDPRVVDALAEARIGEILTDVGKKWQPGASMQQITDSMRRLRSQPLDVRRAAYRAGRIADQRKWYARKQAQNHGRALVANWVLAILEFLGVAFAVLQTLGIVSLNLQTLAAALVSGGIAWTQAQRYQDLSASYSVTAKEAASIEQAPQLRDQVTEDAWAAFVDSAEEAFSREHRLWRAAREQWPPTQ
jgi:hypothetical protein